MKTDSLDTIARRSQELLSFADLKLFGIPFSRAHIYRMIAQGTFPKPVRLSANRVAFKREAIQGHIDNLEEATFRVLGKHRKARRKAKA